MTDKSKTRNVQKEALYEVLQESLKEKNLTKEQLEDLHQLAQKLEEQAFIISNSDINKDYRLKINAIKVKLKGEKGALLRKVLLDNLLTSEQIMKMDMNTLRDDTILLELQQQGINQSKDEILLLSKQNSPQKLKTNPIQSLKLEKSKQNSQNSEQQLNNCEALSEIKLKKEYISEQIPYQVENQHGEGLESQSQIHLLLEMINNKQDNVQQQKKEDEIEQYEPILNSVASQQIPNLKEDEIEEQKQEVLEQEVVQKLKKIEINQEDELNENIIGDDIEISPSKLSKSILNGIETEQDLQDRELITNLYSQINQLRMQNKELLITNQFLEQEQVKLTKKYQNEIKQLNQIHQVEIISYQQQLELAKNYQKLQDEQNIIQLSFQERQNILQDMINKLLNEDPNQNNKLIIQNQEIKHEQNHEIEQVIQNFEKNEINQISQQQQFQQIKLDNQCPPPPKKKEQQVKTTIPPPNKRKYQSKVVNDQIPQNNDNQLQNLLQYFDNPDNQQNDDIINKQSSQTEAITFNFVEDQQQQQQQQQQDQMINDQNVIQQKNEQQLIPKVRKGNIQNRQTVPGSLFD